ncbi:Rieske (2Fe-2S) protein [Acidobacteria bacterium AH-259-G07]|nr:Rieske (2Fe-2S) protein [Acidobacteria bacterium AH-259-G07]
MEQSTGGGYLNVLASGDLEPGQMREISAGTHRIVVGRLYDGTVVAFAPSCPHEAAPLVQGTIRGGSIDCSRHHYMFDVRTGENTFPLPIYPAWKRAQVSDLRLPIFPVIERDGWIAVEPEPYQGRVDDDQENTELKDSEQTSSSRRD